MKTLRLVRARRAIEDRGADPGFDKNLKTLNKILFKKNLRLKFLLVLRPNNEVGRGNNRG